VWEREGRFQIPISSFAEKTRRGREAAGTESPPPLSMPVTVNQQNREDKPPAQRRKIQTIKREGNSPRHSFKNLRAGFQHRTQTTGTAQRTRA